MPGGEREKKCWGRGREHRGQAQPASGLQSSRSVCGARGSRGKASLQALTRKGALVSPASYLLSGTNFHIRPFSCGTSSGSSRKAKCLVTIMRFSPEIFHATSFTSAIQPRIVTRHRPLYRFRLAQSSHAQVREIIRERIGGSRRWALVGGPPCQAYSLVGRSRMMGRSDFEKDERHTLYLEYLRIIADHRPPVFVMETVKGLLSATIEGK